MTSEQYMTIFTWGLTEDVIAARDRALRSVARNANGDWIQLARECALYCAQFLGEFTSDDVWAEIEDRQRFITDGGGVAPTTHEPRAMGPILRSLSQAKIIQSTGRYVKSTRVRSHARPIPVWRRATQ